MKKSTRKTNRNLVDYNWIIKIIIIAFIISIVFTLITEIAIPNVGITIGVILTLVFILIGVLFDMIGIAVTIANEATFHSMASRRVKGAKMAIKLKKNADKVSSFCNDVIGDICGIVSGATASVIAIKIIEKSNCNDLLITLLIMGITSALTIGGKAIEKSVAINKSDKILYNFAKVLSIFSKD